ncbi:VQ motif-containing protein 8, chloroplastic [Panicum miliaceum]|uniref:VQ motif-containing protein 8, chloroplastic n=1 Tax=Panicum miliaceum TaxID=4540 RepID=A0A3L6TAW0_PANMI|nr:VQ motif-containing protein 8, chloroplastic [Panicum miliaceum]
MSTAANLMKRSGVVVGLQGPRPQPLSLPATTPARPSKRPRASGGDGGDAARAPAGPLIVYEHTPRVIHARPDEFKALVQRLTGQQQRATGDQEPVLPLLPAAEPAPSSSQEEATRTAAGDPLVLTLAQQAPPPLDDRWSAGLLSPGAGAFLLSPGSFLFSPATMQAIQELISS